MATLGRASRPLALVVLLATIACGGPAASEPAGEGASTGAAAAVSPVAGRSWIRRLGLTVRETRMGEMGGEAAVPPKTRGEPGLVAEVRSQGGPLPSILKRFFHLVRSDRRRAAALLGETFELTGADFIA